MKKIIKILILLNFLILQNFLKGQENIPFQDKKSNIFYILDSLILNKNYRTAIQYAIVITETSEISSDSIFFYLIYEKIAHIYSLMNLPEKAVEYYKKIIQFPDILPSKKIEIIEKYSEALVKAKQYPEARNLYRKLIEYYEKENICSKKLITYKKLRQTYEMIKDSSEILKIDKEILNEAKNCKSEQDIFLTLNNLGYDYFQLSNYQEALDYFKQAIEISKNIKIDNSLLINTYVNLAISLYNSGQTNESLQWLKKAHDNARKNKFYYHLARVENIMSNIYLFEYDLHNASETGLQSVKNAQLSGNKKLLQECYYTYSQILKECNDPVTALSYYEKYLDLRDSMNREERINQENLQRTKLDIEREEKEIKLKIAGENLYRMRIRQLELEREKERQKKDSLSQANLLNQLQLENERKERNLIEEKYEKEKIKRINSELENDLIIKKLEIDKAKEKEKSSRLEIEKLEAEAKKNALQRSRAIMMTFFLFIIVIGTIIGLLTLRNKNKILAKQRNEIQEKNIYLEQLNEEIKTQKESIEKKNQSITDSIMYAKKIQHALLPSEDLFQKFFSEYFIFFLPRDIVSGDFYWINRISDYVIITVSDCTGHGVPGAFMSMLGIAFLNEIVNNMKQPHSDFILYELRKKVISSLRQKEEESETKDGMDISLCIIDMKHMTLEYSGAYNSIVIIKNNEMQILKADRIPIGIHYKDNELFTRHQIKISKGDIIYMFTDGFVDQFGGPEGKKFKTTNFYELLLTIHNQTMKKQKILISEAFNNWKKNHEQIDDVLVVGIKI